MIDEGYAVLLVGFWRCVKEDLDGRWGEQMRIDAQRFLASKEFEQWADLSNVSPKAMLERLRQSRGGAE